MRSTRSGGFTLLEVLVATVIMAIAVTALLTGLSGAVRNASRLRDHDRVAQLARLRMNELLVDPGLPRNASLDGRFDGPIAGTLDAGWQRWPPTAPSVTSICPTASRSKPCCRR